jgi:hypothetical protein
MEEIPKITPIVSRGTTDVESCAQASTLPQRNTTAAGRRNKLRGGATQKGIIRGELTMGSGPYIPVST